jgi:cold shock protein
VEEQRSLQPGDSAPVHCAGCRTLLPETGRERGMVKWYNIRKRYGFIVRARDAEIFVPASALRGTRYLQTGDLVEFSISANDAGPAADDVTVVGRLEE